MKKLNLVLLAGAAALGVTSAAQAADLMVSAPEAPAYVAPAATGGWDGPYIGVFGGFASGTADHNNDDVASSPVCGTAYSADGCDVDLSGAMLGVDVGANFYLSDNIIGGIVGDIAWSNVEGSDDSSYGIDTSNSIDWQGSVRGVLGLDAGAFMPYLTAGLAVAHGTHTTNSFDPSDATHTGWTAGLGAAIKATDNMSVNVEYRHSDFGTQTYDEGLGAYNPDFDLTQDAVTVGLNWHM